MSKNFILIVIAFIIVAVAGPKIGEIVTERRLIKLVKRQQKLHEMEILRYQKANKAHVEYIKMLEGEKNHEND